MEHKAKGNSQYQIESPRNEAPMKQWIYACPILNTSHLCQMRISCIHHPFRKRIEPPFLEVVFISVYICTKFLYNIFYKIMCGSIGDFKCNSIGFYYSSYRIIFKITVIIFIFTYSMCNS